MKENKNKESIETIKQVKATMDRLYQKMEAMQERFESTDGKIYACKERAQMKRAALDLKSDLTKITQMSAY